MVISRRKKRRCIVPILVARLATAYNVTVRIKDSLTTA
jgi:hypothetical protein